MKISAGPFILRNIIERYFVIVYKHSFIDNCDNFMKRQILVQNEMKQDKISLKLKV